DHAAEHDLAAVAARGKVGGRERTELAHLAIEGVERMRGDVESERLLFSLELLLGGPFGDRRARRERRRLELPEQTDLIFCGGFDPLGNLEDLFHLRHQLSARRA